jgi:hypothetical protein
MRAQASRVGTFVVAVVVVLAARDGAAQGSGAAQRVFAGASVAWNIDSSVWSSGGSEPTGGALAIGVAAGFTFADRWSLQVEGEFPTSDRTKVDQWTYKSGYPYGSQTYTQVRRMTQRTPTVAVLFGVHWRLPKRVDIAFQFGPGFRNEKQNYEDQTLVNGTVTESDQHSYNDWRMGASVGGEVAVGVTSRVTVVGQLRVHVRLGHPLYGDGPGQVVRPAIGVRVKF